MRPSIAFLLSVAFLVLPSRAVRAADPAAAQGAFDDAKRRMVEGDTAGACVGFAESQRLDPGLGTQFHLANCWQLLGRTASAWSLFTEVESQARAMGQNSRAQVAHDRAAALEPWLARLAVVPPGDMPISAPLEIRRDGTPLPRATWAQPVPLDPGVHSVSMGLPGATPWQTTVELRADGKTVTLQLPAFATLVGPGPVARIGPLPSPWIPRGPAAPVGSTMTGVASMMPPSDYGPSGPPWAQETYAVQNRGGGQRTAGWFVVGAGVVGVAAATYLGVRWLDDEGRASARCAGSLCTLEGAQLRHDGREFGVEAAAIGGASVATVIVGAVLIASAPSPQIEVHRARVQVTPTAGPRTAGVAVLGSW